MFCRHPAPFYDGCVMPRNKPRNPRRAASGSDNIGCFHSPELWDNLTAAVNGDPGSNCKNVLASRTTTLESPDIAAMGTKPRQPKPGVRRGAIGQRLHDLRVARGLTQVELAAEVGISRAHIAKIETGGDPPGREVLHAIAQFFGVSMDFLQTGASLPPKPGRFVDRADQLAILDLWEAIPESERPRIIRLIRAAAFD